MRGRLRFLASLVPALILFIAAFAAIDFVSDRVGGGIGLVAGLVAGACLTLGVLLLYWNAVDWTNLRVIRRHRDLSDLVDGRVVAVSGRVEVDGEPMVSPFTAQPCAAYAYKVSEPRIRGARREKSGYVLAQGFHMLPTRIVGAAGAYGLGALPFVEDDLRVCEQGKWLDEATVLFERLGGDSWEGETARESALRDARRRVRGPLHRDFCRIADAGSRRVFNVEEAVVPACGMLCVVGTLERTSAMITANRWRFGPDLMVYRGDAGEVLERVGADVGRFARIALGMLGVSAAILAYALSS